MMEKRVLQATVALACVVVGGLSRLASLIAVGPPSSGGMKAALVMELIVPPPALAFWQHRGARRSALLRP